jgi:hypothetical protein
LASSSETNNSPAGGVCSRFATLHSTQLCVRVSPAAGRGY